MICPSLAFKLCEYFLYLAFNVWFQMDCSGGDRLSINYFQKWNMKMVPCATSIILNLENCWSLKIISGHFSKTLLSKLFCDSFQTFPPVWLWSGFQWLFWSHIKSYDFQFIKARHFLYCVRLIRYQCNIIIVFQQNHLQPMITISLILSCIMT